MDKIFFQKRRDALVETMENGSFLLLFSGHEIRKTADEVYPFFTNRHFLTLTGLDGANLALMIKKDCSGAVTEYAYLMRPDLQAERWSGRRIKADEAREISCIDNITYIDALEKDVHGLLQSDSFNTVYLDLSRHGKGDTSSNPSFAFADELSKSYCYANIKNIHRAISKIRLIKEPCEVKALEKAEEMTKSGIVAMMKSVKPGMYEYQLKAQFDFAISQYSATPHAFPSIISAGENNFCIHYNAYTGQVKDGDMVLVDVGASWDGLIVDVSRGFPANGKFTDRQKLLYSIALEASDYTFSVIKPGMDMNDVDGTVRRTMLKLLVEKGVFKTEDEAAALIWHGGAHHIGWDTHDDVARPEKISAGMAFCVDAGLYHEEWGIGFRVEDNCLVTEDGCINLSRAIPRTIEQIEALMAEGK